jgi:surface antigen
MTRIYLLSVFALALATPAWSLNMSGFRDDPTTRLTRDELKAFRAEVMKVLTDMPDGTTAEWKAPKTRFTSRITPQKTFTDGKRRCRQATVESEAHERFQRGVYTFCKTAKGEWEFRSLPPAARK